MKGWVFMNVMTPNLDPHNIMLLMNEVTPAPPDDQIAFLCAKKDIQCVPLPILLSQYKYCLIHGDAKKYEYEIALKELCPKSLKEMEGLYGSVK